MILLAKIGAWRISTKTLVCSVVIGGILSSIPMSGYQLLPGIFQNLVLGGLVVAGLMAPASIVVYFYEMIDGLLDVRRITGSKNQAKQKARRCKTPT